MELTPAFEFPAELEWLNAEPQNLASHRGRVVVLLFWNASSVYSHNALLELLQIQQKNPDYLSAITIHIPKFTAELDSKFVLDLLSRLNVQLPACNDKNCLMWQKYNIESWPTFIIIDNHGAIVESISGDSQLKHLESKVSEHIGNIQDTLAGKTKEMQVKAKLKSFSILNIPSGLLFHNGLLYISDTGNNRILECTTEGHVKRTFGNGLALNMDGRGSDAAFNRPMGLCVAREYIYIADTGNHAIRRIRILDGTIDTILGNGSPGRASEQTVNAFQNVQLNNPSSVSVQQDYLVIADSGNNSLWMFNLVSRKFSLLVGNGELGLLDGVSARAEMAHPLAIAGAKNYLYVIEGSSSSLRMVAIPEGRVNTLIGHGLFQFGSNDGLRQTAAMQYPNALAVDEKQGIIWIADSYNRKIRKFDIAKGTLSSATIPTNLLNPVALALDDESLWIADSGANYIYRYYIASDYLSRITIQPS